MNPYTGQRITIIGLARQGVALARWLAENGSRVTVTDQQPAEALAEALAGLAGLPIRFELGGHPLSVLDDCDLLCLSGGVDAHSALPQEARRRGIPLSNDAQIFLEVCPSPRTVGITGSAGKTTTTTLVGRMLSQHGPAWVGGNIGNPLIGDVARIRPADAVVLELSSFQLEIMTRSPHISAVLNITPNHLDRHGSMQAYTAAKANILRYQTADDVAVLGWNNVNARDLAKQVRGRLVWFCDDVLERAEGAFLLGDQLIWRWAGREQTIAPLSAIRLRGWHNVLNVLAACAISGAAGADVSAMRAGLQDFTGVPHRLQFVRTVRGAHWYNDSIASAPERVIAAIQSFDEPLVVLCGGRDKKLPWDELAQLAARRVRRLVLFGEAAPLIEAALLANGFPKERYIRCPTLREAVQVAHHVSQPGEVIVLSPGCTSFDAFKDFADRGDHFTRWVHELT